MAMMKRYWRAVGLLCTMAVVVVGLSVHFSRDATLSAVGAAGGSSGSGSAVSDEAMAYRIEYDVLCGVRQEYSLSDEDLAAYGCEAGQAANLITMLRQWYATSGAALAKANENFFAKRGELADVSQRIGMGPRDEQLFDRQEQLQKDVEALRGPLRQIEQGLRQQIQQQLSISQQTLWQAAMANGGLPMAYRYVPNISEQDRAELHRWLRREQLAIIADSGREGGAAGAMPAGIQPASSTVVQLIQAGEAEQTTRRALMAEKLPAVRDATAAVLPPPPVDPSLLPLAEMAQDAP